MDIIADKAPGIVHLNKQKYIPMLLSSFNLNFVREASFFTKKSKSLIYKNNDLVIFVISVIF